MDAGDEAEVWIRARLDVARTSIRLHPPGPGDLTLERYEQQLRQHVDRWSHPTSHYVGLTLHAAEAQATRHGDVLCVHQGRTGHRASWRADRVHVELDTTNQVTTATRDSAPWR